MTPEQEASFEIDKTRYHNLISKIDDEMISVSAELNDIEDTLKTLKIPNDYLGEKVQQRIDTLCDNFSYDADSIKTEKSKIDSFVTAKINERNMILSRSQGESENKLLT